MMMSMMCGEDPILVEVKNDVNEDGSEQRQTSHVLLVDEPAPVEKKYLLVDDNELGQVVDR